MTETAKPFSFREYRAILNAAKEQDYTVSSFAQFDPGMRRTIIMRHDVDYTLNGVRQFAEIEFELGVSATYLFRVHAHEYNLFAPHTFVLIERLRSMGHEIGLHFEATTVGRALDIDPIEMFKRELEVMETVTGHKVETVSEHRDISHVVHSTAYLHELVEIETLGVKRYALSPTYFGDMKYLSDSNAVWREGGPLAHLGKHDRFQILIHPDWWFEEDLLLKGPYFHGLGN